MVSLLLLSLIPDGALMENGMDDHFSVINYVTIFSGNEFFQPLLNSLQAAVTAVLIALLAGLLVAHLLKEKVGGWLKIGIETIASLPYGIPGTVIAICLILSFNQPSVFSFNQILIGTFWILPIAYAIRNLPLITQSIKTGLHSIDASIEEAAAALGATAFKIWRQVTLPMIAPFVIEGALLVFINSFGEFVATVLLYTFSTKTMPVEVYAQMRLYNNGMAATYGFLLFLVVLILIFLSRKITRKFNLN
jgi:iron(III) transport system permease protein